MANPLDTDVGSELFSSYEAELKLVQADLNQKLDQIAELSGEPRKSAIRLAERSVEEANELVGNRPTSTSHLPSLNVFSNNEIYSSIKCASRSRTFLRPPGPR